MLVFAWTLNEAPSRYFCMSDEIGVQSIKYIICEFIVTKGCSVKDMFTIILEPETTNEIF